jgi:hypothetical protein
MLYVESAATNLVPSAEDAIACQSTDAELVLCVHEKPLPLSVPVKIL